MRIEKQVTLSLLLFASVFQGTTSARADACPAGATDLASAKALCGFDSASNSCKNAGWKHDFSPGREKFFFEKSCKLVFRSRDGSLLKVKEDGNKTKVRADGTIKKEVIRSEDGTTKIKYDRNENVRKIKGPEGKINCVGSNDPRCPGSGKEAQLECQAPKIILHGACVTAQADSAPVQEQLKKLSGAEVKKVHLDARTEMAKDPACKKAFDKRDKVGTPFSLSEVCPDLAKKVGDLKYAGKKQPPASKGTNQPSQTPSAAAAAPLPVVFDGTKCSLRGKSTSYKQVGYINMNACQKDHSPVQIKGSKSSGGSPVIVNSTSNPNMGKTKNKKK